MAPENNIDHLLRRVPPSATLAINERSKALAAAGQSVIKFGFGESPFPVPGEVTEALKNHAARKEYAPVQGLPSLRIAIADNLRRNFQQAFDSEHIIVGPGSKELIFSIQLALDLDLILPAPSWVSYAPQALLAGKKTHWLQTSDTNDWMIMPNELDAICRQNPRARLLILNHPSNPTGQSYQAEYLNEMAGIIKNHQVLVISDEIYRPLSFDSAIHSISEFCPQNTIVTGGISKWCGAGGWRLGFAAFPESLSKLLETVKGIASETFTAVSTPIQLAGEVAFRESDSIKLYIKRSRLILKEIADYVFRHLNEIGIEVRPSLGGFYVFIGFDKLGLEVQTSTELCKTILEETGVALLPGSDFGCPPTQLSARLAYVDFDGQQALNWIETQDEANQEQLMSACCPQIVEGVNRLKQWVKTSR